MTLDSVKTSVSPYAVSICNTASQHSQWPQTASSMRGTLFLSLMVAFVLLAVVLDNGSSGGALAKSRGRSSSRGSSSRGTSSRGTSSRGTSSYGSSSSRVKTKTKSKTKSNLKKAAVIGATAYAGYKLGKLKGKFGKLKAR